jgi:hypothetical protein
VGRRPRLPKALQVLSLRWRLLGVAVASVIGMLLGLQSG